MKKLLPVNRLALSVAIALPAMLTAQQIPFTNQTALLPSTTFHSGNAIGVCDMNGDFKDDIVRDSMNKKMFIEFQNAPNATFTETPYVTGSFGSPWGLCIGDYNNDGYNDVFQGSSSKAYLLTSNSAVTFTRFQVTDSIGGGNVFTQGCNFADIDNDGFLDMFICHDTGMPKVYKGNGVYNGWVFNQALIPLATVPASDNSGNYASIWTDVNADGYIDLMITHCRQSVSNSSDARRIDQIFINNGNGTYTQDVTNWTNLRDGAQGWSTAWGDIDNDGDMDAFVLNYDVNSTLNLNNGSGVFTNVMSTSGISNTTSFFGMNATFQDFDNDTYLDLLLSGDNHYLYKGNGNGTFTLVTPNAFPYSTNTITSHAIGDLNGDGFLDVYASYTDVYNTPNTGKNDRVWMNDCPNQGNTNHWIKFNLIGGGTTGMSNKNGVGAIVKIYGPWGVQVREVRSGEAYGIQNSFTVHFGLGQNTTVDSVIVAWPSGVVDHASALPGDQGYTINEGAFATSTHTAINQRPVELNVYPNPSNDVSYIRVDHFAQYGLNNLSVNIYDVNCKLVYSEGELQNSIIAIDRGTLTSGVYFVELRSKDKRLATQKLMIQ